MKRIIKALKNNKYVSKSTGMNLSRSKVAQSLAIGAFIGLAVPVGLQTAIAVPLALAFQGSAFLAYLGTNVTNPLTVAPIYIFAFKLGAFIIGGGYAEKSLHNLLAHPSFNALWEFGANGLTAFLLGCFILAVITSVAVYYLSLKFAHKFIKTPSVN